MVRLVGIDRSLERLTVKFFETVLAQEEVSPVLIDRCLGPDLLLAAEVHIVVSRSFTAIFLEKLFCFYHVLSEVGVQVFRLSDQFFCDHPLARLLVPQRLILVRVNYDPIVVLDPRINELDLLFVVKLRNFGEALHRGLVVREVARLDQTKPSYWHEEKPANQQLNRQQHKKHRW